MISTDNLCMSCMREIGDEKRCPHCGYYTDSAQISPYLPVRTVIANRYLVGKILEYNGEGATYIGWDLSEKKAVKIREFIPDSFTIRTSSDLTLKVMRGSEAVFSELRQSFEELWNKLARLRGLSALISVNEVVEDYGTSYAIYDHFEGIPLRDLLLRSKTGYISWEKARQLLMPILSTLGTLHSAGIIHRGISPSTLMVTRDGKIKITGFCIGAARTVRSDLNSQLFDGYSAIEQYGFDGQQGPWTDIYAFTAVLYRTLIGTDPISARERMSNDRLMVPGKFAETLPAYVINGLINGLQILPEDRTRTVDQLRAELSASPSAAASGGGYQREKAPERSAPKAPKQKKKEPKSDASIIITSAVICLAVGLIIFLALSLTVFKDRFRFSSSSAEKETVTLSAGEPVAVPNFSGRSYVDISSNPVFTRNFKFDEELVYDDEVAEGYVVNQDVPADSQVPPGTVIKLYVSKGKEMNVLPNVIGWNYSTAYERLTELGFVVDRLDISEGSHGDNEVIKMAPIAEKSYAKGTKVMLSVFKSPVTEPPETEPEEIYEEPEPEHEENEDTPEETPEENIAENPET